MGVNIPLVICIGNGFRGDDAVGLEVATRLEEKALGNGITVLQQSGDGATLMESWKGHACVILVDAMRSGGPPGAIHRLDAGEIDAKSLPNGVSSHGFGIREAIDLGKILGRLPSKLIIYGIEASEFDFGTELSPKVIEAVDEVVTRILEEAECMSLA